MHLKRRKMGVLLLAILLSFTLSACSKNEQVVEWNQEDLEYFKHISLSIDETNMYEYVGAVDYVFVGTVSEVKNNLIAEKGDSDISTYKIQVEKNIKGELVDEIIAKKHGGISKDGTMLLYFSDKRKDSGLPIEGKTYIFMAYGQNNGELLLSEFLDEREYSEDLLEEYQDYYANEIPNNRSRFTSKYDKNYK